MNDVANINGTSTKTTITNGGGTDTFNVGATGSGNLELLTGALSILGGGSNSIILDDSASGIGSFYNVTKTTVTATLASGVARLFAGLTFDVNAKSIALTGSSLSNHFSVSPNSQIAYLINGHKVGLVTAASETLSLVNLTTNNVSNPLLTSTGATSGYWSFTAPTKQVSFTGITVDNGVPGYVSPVSGDTSPSAAPMVDVFDASSGVMRGQFAPNYPASFHGGVRVTTADFNGDGIPDIVTAPGRGMTSPQLFVYSGIDYSQIASLTLPSTFVNGVNVAAGYITGGVHPDLIVSTSLSNSIVAIYTYNGAGGFTLYKSFNAYPGKSLAGVTVAVMGSEIVTAPEAGAQVEVRLFNKTGVQQNTTPLIAIDPNFRGGATISVADVDGDGTLDIVVAAGLGGNSRVQIFHGLGNNKFTAVPTFTVFTDASRNAALRVSAKDLDGSGINSMIFTQGVGSTSGQVRALKFAGYVGNNPALGLLPLQVVDQVYSGFSGGYVA
jgi:hypothetical protein